MQHVSTQMVQHKIEWFIVERRHIEENKRGKNFYLPQIILVLLDEILQFFFRLQEIVFNEELVIGCMLAHGKREHALLDKRIRKGNASI